MILYNVKLQNSASPKTVLILAENIQAAESGALEIHPGSQVLNVQIIADTNAKIGDPIEHIITPDYRQRLIDMFQSDQVRCVSGGLTEEYWRGYDDAVKAIINIM